MDTESSIKAYLDSLAQVPGAVLYRNGLHWQGLAPGNAGQVLTLDDAGLPAWETPNRYAPAMLQYSGPTPHFRRNGLAITNNSHTMLARIATSGTTVTRYHFTVFGATTLVLTAALLTTGHLYIAGQNSAGATAFQVRSINTVIDGKPRYMFFEYNRLTGAVTWIINGQNADFLTWPSRVANAATIQAGASAGVFLGSANIAGQYWADQIGTIGYKQTTGLDWTDFMTPNGRPKPLDTTGWSEWAGQPPIWHESGELDFNRGSYGAFTKNPTISLANPLIWS